MGAGAVHARFVCRRQAMCAGAVRGGASAAVGWEGEGIGVGKSSYLSCFARLGNVINFYRDS